MSTTPPLLCAFALGRDRYCMRPAGHEATDGRLPRHDSTPSDNDNSTERRCLLCAQKVGESDWCAMTRDGEHRPTLPDDTEEGR